MNNNKKRDQEQLHKILSGPGLWKLRFRRFFRLTTWFLIVQFISSVKRISDLLLAVFMILLFSPLILAVFVYRKIEGCGLKRIQRSGKWNIPFDEFNFDVPDNAFGKMITVLKIDKLPVLFNIFRGDISFVGPRILSFNENATGGGAKFEVNNVRPGLISLWQIKRGANIDFENPFDTDLEYVQNQSFLGDMGLALRVIPGILYGSGIGTAPDNIEILGIHINNLTMEEAVDRILNSAGVQPAYQVCFVNADCVNIAYKDKDYNLIIEDSQLILADGIGVKIAGKLLAKDIKQNINGTDLFPRLCGRLENTGIGIYLLGARPGVVEKVAGRLKDNYPDLTISGMHHGYLDQDDEEIAINDILQSGAKILFVAFGVPLQDKWIHRNVRKTGVSVAMGVGGLFDFYSGEIPRAPMWMREIGIEWFYRFLQEPSRMWKRYFIGNTLFLIRVIREKLSNKNRP